MAEALPLIRRMIYLLLYEESSGKERLHTGGTVWKGDSEKPARPIAMGCQCYRVYVIVSYQYSLMYISIYMMGYIIRMIR